MIHPSNRLERRELEKKKHRRTKKKVRQEGEDNELLSVEDVPEQGHID